MNLVFLILFPFITLGLILQQNVGMALKVRGGVPTSSPKNYKGNAANPLIEKACANAQYKDLCIQTLKSQPESKTANMKELVFLSLNKTKSLGSEIAAWVGAKLEDQESMGPGIEQALTDCNDQYTDAMAQLEDSLAAFFSNNGYKDINTWMTTAMKNADSCEESLQKGNAVDVMGDKNKIFAQHCSNALAVVNALAKKQ